MTGSYSHRPGAVALSLDGKERQNILCPYSIDTGNLLSNLLTFCHAAVKQRRHTCPRRRVTFSLPPSQIDKDSMVWRRGCPPNERTTYCIDPLTAHLPSPTSTPLPGHPHPSHGILATSTSGAACSVYYIYGAAPTVALAAQAAGTPFDPRSLDL